MPDNRYTPEFVSITDEVTTPSSPQNQGFNPTSYQGNGTQEKREESTSANTESVTGKKPKKFSLGLSFFTDMRWRIVLGVIFIVIAAFLFISVISYFFSATADQSEVEGSTLEQIVSNPDAGIRNWGGPGGALISHTIVTHGLGIGVLPILIYLVVIGLALLDIRKCNFWSATFKALLLAVTLSMVLGLASFDADAVMPLGGYHGFFMNYLIIERFAWPGAVAVSLILLGCIVGVYFYDIMKVYSRFKQKLDERRRRTRERIEQRTRMMQNAEAQLNAVSPDSATNRQGTDVSAEDKPQSDPLNDFNDVINSIGAETPNENQATEPQAVNDNETVTEVATEKVTAAESATESAGSVGNDATVTAQHPSDTTSPVQTKSDEEEKEAENLLQQAIDSTPEADNREEDIFKVNETEEIEQGKISSRHLDPTAELSRFKMPTAELLDSRPVSDKNVDIEEIEDKKNQIIEALNRFNIGISSIEATVGPTVTMYEIVPAEGVKIATIKRLEEDIAMALAALSTRIIAPIPGKSAIGIEVPNKAPRTVDVRTIFSSKDFLESEFELPLALGVTIDNRVYMADLAKMPHLLVAGATGKGKSVGMNVIINSLLFKKHPSELKLVLIDPKMVEFYPYRKIVNHYLAQVPDAENAIITDTSKVVDTLNSLCVEMDDRYELLQQAEVVKINHYNKLWTQGKLNPEKGHHYLPYIVVIVDEYADLLMTAGKEIERPIARLAQKARAVGIHVIIATQRPSANIITGVIKGNFPARIAFKVTSNVDSNIILGNSGAFQLIGNGDMLVSQDGELQRVQCAFISTDEIKNIAQFVGDQAGFGEPMYLPEPPMTGDKNGAAAGASGNVGETDPLLSDIAKYVVNSGVASTSNIQRNYQIGYNRAGRIMDQLQALGIVSPQQGSKPRDILVDIYRLEEILTAL